MALFSFEKAVATRSGRKTQPKTRLGAETIGNDIMYDGRRCCASQIGAQ